MHRQLPNGKAGIVTAANSFVDWIVLLGGEEGVVFEVIYFNGSKQVTEVVTAFCSISLLRHIEQSPSMYLISKKTVSCDSAYSNEDFYEDF